MPRSMVSRYRPYRRSRDWKVRIARSRSIRRNAGQFTSVKWNSLWTLCQSRNPDSRNSPLVRMIRSGSGRLGRIQVPPDRLRRDFRRRIGQAQPALAQFTHQ